MSAFVTLRHGWSPFASPLPNVTPPD